MKMNLIQTDAAPKAIGPYSQAVKAGNFLFLSGQIAIDPATGAMAGGGVEGEARQVLKNLAAVLSAEGLTFGDVVETAIYLVNMKDFQVVNTLYGEAMGGHKPARATVAVAALPKEARIEIKMTAVYRG